MASALPQRRHRTRQREQILATLRATARHPSARELHRELQRDCPRLALGTVYRNLEILVAEGQVREVPTAGRASRYDGNPLPHHHFICESCGEIHDLDVRVPSGLMARVQARYGLRTRRLRIDFFGLCPSCGGAGPRRTRRTSNHAGVTRTEERSHG
ncbi:MAG: Fur family transcriptional regulator [Myxococcota bacterium]